MWRVCEEVWERYRRVCGLPPNFPSNLPTSLHTFSYFPQPPHSPHTLFHSSMTLVRAYNHLFALKKKLKSLQTASPHPPFNPVANICGNYWGWWIIAASTKTSRSCQLLVGEAPQTPTAVLLCTLLDLRYVLLFNQKKNCPRRTPKNAQMSSLSALSTVKASQIILARKILGSFSANYGLRTWWPFFGFHLISGKKLDTCGRDDILFFLRSALDFRWRIGHLRTWQDRRLAPQFTCFAPSINKLTFLKTAAFVLNFKLCLPPSPINACPPK